MCKSLEDMIYLFFNIVNNMHLLLDCFQHELWRLLV